VAGYCNANISGNVTKLQGPWGIYVSPLDGILYVADEYLPAFLAFSPFSRTERVIFSSGVVEPMDIFVDSSNTIYMTDRSLNDGTVFVQRGGTIVRSFPTAGQLTSSCLLSGVYQPYGLTVDRSGNIYVGLWLCYAVVKWAPNATTETLVAGRMGIPGSASDTFDMVRFVQLDED
jgi:DNA-binding beta-propeller fold protein YncE